jgi:hypothetical protein
MSDQPSIPIPLTPERRLTRIAAVLARGNTRLHRAAEHSDPQNLGDSRRPDLEVVSEARLYVLGRPSHCATVAILGIELGVTVDDNI